MSARYVNFNSNVGTSLPIGDNSSGLLSTLRSAGGKLNNTTWIVIGVVILFVIIAILYYFYSVVPSRKSKYQPNNEHNSDDVASGKSAELLFFFADWCPHCKAAKPIWNDLKAEYENKTINGYHVVFTEIDCSEETAEVDKMMNQYNIEGYPTIKLLKDGQVIEYDAKPSKATLTQFLNTVL
jgi:thiol-disulfide isomerase/thioredoxin